MQIRLNLYSLKKGFYETHHLVGELELIKGGLFNVVNNENDVSGPTLSNNT